MCFQQEGAFLGGNIASGASLWLAPVLGLKVKPKRGSPAPALWFPEPVTAGMSRGTGSGIRIQHVDKYVPSRVTGEDVAQVTERRPVSGSRNGL